MARVRWAHRCTATSRRTGLPCRAYAIEGGYVCRMHGGAIGHVRRKAQVRLAAWRAQRRLGRPLRPFEIALLTGDRRALNAQVHMLVAEIREGT